MKHLSIVFMGTPAFAVTTLKALVEKHYTIVGVVTAPDKPAGRGRKLNESAVKQYAKSQNLLVLQPTNLKDNDFINTLKSLKANLQIVVAFRMLPQVVWQIPQYGTFNLHASLLPNYRGAAPINWAIINGETKTGVTTFFIDEKIDTGAIILQDEITISTNENAGNLHDKLMLAGSALVLKTVALIERGEVKTIPQDKCKDLKTAHKLNKNNCKINWEDSIDAIYNKVRGLSPYPAAWARLINGEDAFDVKIYSCKREFASHTFANGSIITTKKEIKVALTHGYLVITEIKLPGKKMMDASSLLNGYTFKADAKML